MSLGWWINSVILIPGWAPNLFVILLSSHIASGGGNDGSMGTVGAVVGGYVTF